MTSGKQLDIADESNRDSVVRYIMLNSMIFLGCTLLVVFGLESLERGALVQGVFDLFMAFMTVVAFILLRTSAPYMLSAFLTVLPYLGLCAFLAISAGEQASGILWMYSFPLLSIFLLGKKPGIVTSGILLALVSAGLFVPGLSPFEFASAFSFRIIGVYILVTVCTVVYEETKLTKDRWVAKLTRALKAERDEIAAMKDNLKVGLFMMDRDFVIQPQYSPVFEKIMGEQSLQGRRFLDLLSNSIAQREQETLVDYFTMIINRSFDAQMLEDINPLHQFSYISLGTGEEKILRCTFAPVEREPGTVFILGTIQDSTVEVALQKQLNEEEGRRSEEMHALFEVIHVDPRVLNDFIEDAEYEFDRINAILKDKSRTSADVIVEMYQGVHAIKSNAVILGLTSFGTKLHALEDELRDLRSREDVTFQDILHITVELDKLMKVKDGFKDLIDRIRSFNRGDNRLQDEQVLVTTLQKVVDKASKDLGKEASLVIRSIDSRVFEHGPRRMIKEVLTQLVRNSMYHGIEDRDSRLAVGKDGHGQIALSIEMKDNQIIIQLTDDGKGLDFAAIRDKAVSLGMIPPETEVSDRNTLLQLLFAPGFSTAQTANMHAGRGIGLNLVRERVKEWKGSIKLQSEDGRGTAFRIIVPLEAQAMQGAVSA